MNLYEVYFEDEFNIIELKVILFPDWSSYQI